MDAVLLLLAFAVILAGSELFTNGIEWFGHKLELGEGAIGSVLAAVGTALPETMIPLIAIVFTGGIAASEVGVGAILGAPFMLSTLALFVTGVAIFLMRGRRTTGTALNLDLAVVNHDMAYFAVGYAVAIGAAFLPTDLDWARRLTAVLLLGLYGYHVLGHLKAEAAAHEGLEPLRFHKFDRRSPPHPEPPRLFIVVVQVAFSLACIVGGAWMFVHAVDDLSSSLALNGTLLALAIAPMATELPESVNAFLWVGRGKDTLALGNITGAMVFQAAIPTSIGLLFAPHIWAVSGSEIAFASAGVAFLSSAAVFLPSFFGRRPSGRTLLVGGIFYVAYLAVVVVALAANRA